MPCGSIRKLLHALFWSLLTHTIATTAATAVETDPLLQPEAQELTPLMLQPTPKLLVPTAAVRGVKTASSSISSSA